MRKLLCALMMLPLLSMGQMSKEYVDDVVDLKLEYVSYTKKPSKSANNHAQIHPGVALMLGGGMFTLLGLTTPREGEFVDGHHQPKPFYRSGAPFFATVTGGVMLLSGIVITIGQ
jgi:hypothetical protein